MNEIFKQVPLYRFIMNCNEETMDKTVLDCSPLSLFSEYGYLAHGIEFDKRQLEKANTIKFVERYNS